MNSPYLFCQFLQPIQFCLSLKNPKQNVKKVQLSMLWNTKFNIKHNVVLKKNITNSKKHQHIEQWFYNGTNKHHKQSPVLGVFMLCISR